MPEVQLKKLYMAKNMEALNKKIYVDLQANPEKLLKSSKIILREAEKSDRENDEELAYIYFMRYFSVIKSLQQSEEFKKNKKYYTSVLDRKVTKKAIQRSEELSNSLQRRYNLLVTANESSKEETVLKTAEEKAPKAPKIFPVKDTAITDGFITCEKLFSLTKEMVSSFLVIDVRSKEAFETSSMKISTLINIPEEVLKPGVTADKAGRELDAESRLLWGRRHLFDYIIICDNCTDFPPLHPSIVVLKDAMEKWDPGKSYRAKSCVLKGGFEMFSHTYPMMISNPRALFSTTFNSFNNNNDNSFLSENLSQLNISFPDLNEGFLNTPSPETKLFPDLDSPVAPPQVNRSLKPKATLHQQPEMKHEESRDKDSPPSSVSDLQSVDSSSTSISVNDGKMLNNSMPPSASYNHAPPSRAFGAWLSCSSSSSEEDVPNVRNEDINKKPASSGLLKGDTLPKIPNRNLKRTEILESYSAKNKILDESKKILEMSYNAEKDTLEKLHEIEEAHKSRELSSDEDMQKKLGASESRLRVDLEETKKRAKEMENEFSEVNLKNEEMSDHLSNIASNHSDNLGFENNFYYNEQIKEKETLMMREEEQKALLKQVELLRKKRKEKEKAMEEQLKREKLERRRGKENEDQRKPSANKGHSNVEHNRVSDRQSTKTSTSSRRRPGETYTTKLKTSPNHSPVRGSGNLRRSHSALNLSQLKDENGFDAASPSTVPNFDRNLKPFSSPRWRNVQEARLRNFEPKFGSVPATKTGLKNLGNTCYMNSIIQCLSNTHRLATYFFQGSYSESLNPKSNQKGEVAVEFGEVVRALWCCQYRSISMYDLKSVVGRHHKPFQGYDQHDSHEFLIKFMDWLHDDLNKVREKFPKMEEQNFDNVSDDKAAQLVMERLQERDASIVRTTFYGLHRSVIVCHTCSNRSLTFEPFSVLTLSFPASGRCTLKDMLHEFYKETRIEYRCDSCRRLTNCTRKFDIWKLPPVLIIHLNRFEHDILMKKKQNFVDFPLENLNFTEYLSDSFNYRTYDLYGVSNHYGTIDGGHYTAFCKSPQQAWYKFDDHEVYDISRESVKTSAAYILFYEASEPKSAY